MATAGNETVTAGAGHPFEAPETLEEAVRGTVNWLAVGLVQKTSAGGDSPPHVA